jgi:accessory gene regulator protein AgrB
MRTKTIWQILLSFLRFVLAAYAFYLAIDFTGMLRYLVISIGISLIVMVVEDTQKEE